MAENAFQNQKARREWRVLLDKRKWRRRESNPRPKSLSLSVYMFILWYQLQRDPEAHPAVERQRLFGLFFVPYAGTTRRSGLVCS